MSHNNNLSSTIEFRSKDKAFPGRGKAMPITFYPDEVLLKQAQPVEDFGKGLRELCNNMLRTMYQAPGIGLAAPQVGLAQRIFVCDVGYDRTLLDSKGKPIEAKRKKRKKISAPTEESEGNGEEVVAEEEQDQQISAPVAAIEFSELSPLIFINPEIVDSNGTTTYEEGCLSLPGIFDTVERHKNIEIRYQDTDGKYHYRKADDLLSICCQHELDHLNGILFIQRLSKDKFKSHHEQFLQWRKQQNF